MSSLPPPLHKYPRTRHLEGSRLQPGDQDLESVPFGALAGRRLVVEEKVDGANAALSFDASGRLWLQSRGHFLTGGDRERQFSLFKQWAHTHRHRLFDRLGSRYVVYGEWLYAKHTVFYDRLPHYFLEFDVLDAQEGAFLSTPCRRELLQGLPIASVPVLREGAVRTSRELVGLLGPSQLKTPAWKARLAAVATSLGLDVDQVIRETDSDDRMEGLYVKDEEGGRVVGRYKYIRRSFLTTVLDSGSHWADRPIVPNQLRDGVDLFGEAP